MLILLGLGANMGDPPATLAWAAAALSGRYRLCGISSLWRSEPVGPPQPDYDNAALLIESEAHPLQVLAICRRLEAAAGRTEGPRWGPRPLDIDLLLADGVVMEGPTLSIPHPSLAYRRFALLPAAELVPDWLHPRRQLTIAELAAACDPTDQRCTRLGPFPG